MLIFMLEHQDTRPRLTRTSSSTICPCTSCRMPLIMIHPTMTVGIHHYGPPATLEKGTRALTEYLRKELAISAEQSVVVEGSGISRKNRLTPDAVLLMLKAFLPYQHLLPREKNIPYKTGTLSGVYSMAGYLSTSDPMYFVILLNQQKNYREKIRDILLKTDFYSY